MASIIEKVDVKGDTKPEFVIVKGYLEELEAFGETGMQVDLHCNPAITVVIGETHDTAASQLTELESCLMADLNWSGRSAGDAERRIQFGMAPESTCGRLRGFVWFGTGFGWEDRQQRLDTLPLKHHTTMAGGCLPKVAVICLKYGAQAAEALHMRASRR